MTPIQAAALTPGLEGKDVRAQAKTGSGKTLAFALPLLAKINPADFGAQALVLCPTRELAGQVAVEIRRLARYRDNIKVVTLCGGQPIGPQIGSLEHGAHIVVGTPGRIQDHLRKKTLSISRVRTLVLDEADRMLEMGFVEAISSIVAETPSSRQTLLFSATYPSDIESLSEQFQTAPVEVKVESLHSENKIEQKFVLCQQGQQGDALIQLLRHYRPERALVFCNTKSLVREVDACLQEQGISALALHGDMEQRDRDQVLVQFKQQSCSVLVATDVAARGLDIDDLAAVINYELPRDPEIYVHRIGRTGRGEKSGLALSLFADNELYRIKTIEQYLQRELAYEALEQLELEPQAFPSPAYVSLCIAGGRKNKVRPGDILGALTGDAGIPGSAVGNISIGDHRAFVAVERSVAQQALQKLSDGKIKGRKFRVRSL